ncbi:MAG: type I-E CRISPR-associated protein Cas6/Cse3/CasE [Acidobacteriota bacterium]|nr:type I-E CRISPR-associated protein Cas6/Cse3/CasE [Blastocatellia bacterium]MDW8413229.1 type I-E CRISPR-associated protein Cas6/Cse3/CasE [Acidobacteriota bacterium]
MYLSKLLLNPRNKFVQRDLNDCQQIHQRLLSAFPKAESSARAEFGLLFRIENNPGQLYILAQSKILPDWSNLPQGYLLQEPLCKDVSKLYTEEVLYENRYLAFRLRANPTRKIETKSLPNSIKQNGRRVELYRKEEQVAWLQRKAAANGFRVCSLKIRKDTPNLNVNPEAKIYGVRYDKISGKNKKLTFGSVLFEGELQITNPQQFKKCLENGIGSGKAYGFGLLSIANAYERS